jgi:hypothetical protein
MSDARVNIVRWVKCLFRHCWDTHQVLLRPDNDARTFVLAWKQCERCGSSKLIHILT